MPRVIHLNRRLTEREAGALSLEVLRRVFAFGVPGGRTTVQRRVGRFLGGDREALDGAPTIGTSMIDAETLGHFARIGVIPMSLSDWVRGLVK